MKKANSYLYIDYLYSALSHMVANAQFEGKNNKEIDNLIIHAFQDEITPVDLNGYTIKLSKVDSIPKFEDLILPENEKIIKEFDRNLLPQEILSSERDLIVEFHKYTNTFVSSIDSSNNKISLGYEYETIYMGVDEYENIILTHETNDIANTKKTVRL